MAAPRKKQSDQDRWKDKFSRQAPRRQERLLSLVGVQPAEKEEPAAPEDQAPEDQSLGPTVGPKQGLAPNPQSLGPTVGPSIAEKSLRTNGQSQVFPRQGEGILLAPLQWEVLQVLEGVATSRAIISVRQIANQVGASIEGVKKAIRVLKQVGILQTTAVRTAEVQGFQVDLQTTIPVRKGTLNEARGIVKRLGLTPNGQSQAFRTDPRRMYVCKKNTYIQGLDLTELLRVCPPSWKIREATLITIADSYPDMDKTIFRLSLLRAVEQAKEGKTAVRNANAWLRAAFEKNGAPLITARDIEAQVTRGQGGEVERSAASRTGRPGPTVRQEEDEILRQYMAAPEEQRREIDRRAEEKLKKMSRMVSQVGPDKHQAILVQARIDAARAVLAVSADDAGETGEGGRPA